MAGHSKWANIQHRKGRQDALRARLFSRLVREVAVAARLAGGDPESNPRLRAAMDAAQASNIPGDTITRAITRATGSDEDTARIEEVRYEGYAPGGVALIVDCQTDNRNRTVSDVRYAFTKSGGNLGTAGSVAHLFTRCAVFSFSADCDGERLFEQAAEAGADDVVTCADGHFEVIATATAYAAVRQRLAAAGLTAQSAVLTMRPRDRMPVGAADAPAVQALLQRLEEVDDVQNVYCNAAPETMPANDA